MISQEPMTAKKNIPAKISDNTRYFQTAVILFSSNFAKNVFQTLDLLRKMLYNDLVKDCFDIKAGKDLNYNEKAEKGAGCACGICYDVFDGRLL